MAVVDDIYGKVVSGKVGTVAFYMSKGKTVMRSLRVDKSGPRTENQLRNQRRFQKIREFCSLFKDVVIPQIWNGVATTSSGYHLFMKTNTAAFDPEGIIDPMKIRLSMGKLTLPEGMQARRTSLGGNTIEVKWEPDTHFGGLPLRGPLLAISAGEGKYSNRKDTALMRGNLGGTFELPELASPATHVYLFFESLDQRYYSESVCFEI